MNEEDKLNDFRNMISTFIDENCVVRTGDINAEILFDESDGGKILDKNLKELFEETKKL